ncbi:hypothetical protein AAF712_013179 [Marasmius tenuissimus]|uniref:Uncharacterized protein n=1 Tax=Marasmius tenuissimus TaxID=585030 RepID=A0ABR2ZEQ3_9AGAR
MEPVNDFELFRDWNSFAPSMKGYVEPKGCPQGPLDLKSSFSDAADRIEEVYAKVVAVRSVEDPVNPGIVIAGGDLLRLPLEKRVIQEIEALDGAQCNSRSTMFEASKTRTKPQLDSFTVISGEGDGGEGVHIGKAFHGSSAGIVHILILPTDAPATTVTVSHSSKFVDTAIEGDSRFKMTSFVTYAGYDNLSIATPRGGSVSVLIYHFHPPDLPHSVPSYWVSGIIPEIRDFFAEWRYSLLDDPDSQTPKVFLHYLNSHHVNNVSKLDDGGTKLVAHLVSPAKAYGFSWFLGHARHETSCDHKVMHGYKEYVEVEEDYRKVRNWDIVEDNKRVRLYWEKIIGPEGDVAKGEARDIISQVEKAWEADNVDLEDQIMVDCHVKKTVECKDDSVSFPNLQRVVNLTY